MNGPSKTDPTVFKVYYLETALEDGAHLLMSLLPSFRRISELLNCKTTLFCPLCSSYIFAFLSTSKKSVVLLLVAKTEIHSFILM